jgi:hypothetical protein
MPHKIIFFLFFISFSAHSEEKFVLTHSIVNAYNSVIDFKINDAKNYLIEDKIVSKNNAFRYLIENYIDLVNLLIEDNSRYYQIAQSNRLKRIEALEQCDKKSAFYYYALSEIHMQWAFIRMKFGEQIKCANEFRLAAKYDKLNEEKFPEFLLNNKHNAIIQAIAASIPPNFSWFGSQLNIKGNLNSSINKLNELIHFTKVNTQYNFIKTELEFIKLFIQLNLSGRSLESFNLLEMTTNKELNKPLLNLYFAINLMKQGETEKSLDLIDTLMVQKNGLDFSYLNYLKAENFLNSELNDKGYYNLFLQNYKGKSFIKAAFRKKAWLSLINNNLNEYNYYIKKVLIDGVALNEDDKQALSEAESKIIPNSLLLSARIYFDGGKFDLALNKLAIINFLELSLIEKSEYFYRRARCFQKKNEFSKALIDFNNAIQISKKSNNYIMAVASFYQGQLFEQTNKNDIAIESYEAVLKTSKHPYKSSLDAKAKAAIQRLKN